MNKEKQKLKIVMCALAKNEEFYVNDWLLHYFRMGFDEITIYDNNDVDKKGILLKTIKKCPEMKQYLKNVHIVDVVGKAINQRKIYAEFFNEHDFDWLGCLDMDEYIDLNGSASNIKELLSNYDDCLELSLRTYNYGDNDLIESDPSIPVMERFTTFAPIWYDNFFKSIRREIKAAFWASVLVSKDFCFAAGTPGRLSTPPI